MKSSSGEREPVLGELLQRKIFTLTGPRRRCAQSDICAVRWRSRLGSALTAAAAAYCCVCLDGCARGASAAEAGLARLPGVSLLSSQPAAPVTQVYVVSCHCQNNSGIERFREGESKKACSWKDRAGSDFMISRGNFTPVMSIFGNEKKAYLEDF